jgi:hypothetical protein
MPVILLQLTRIYKLTWLGYVNGKNFSYQLSSRKHEIDISQVSTRQSVDFSSAFGPFLMILNRSIYIATRNRTVLISKADGVAGPVWGKSLRRGEGLVELELQSNLLSWCIPIEITLLSISTWIGLLAST